MNTLIDISCKNYQAIRIVIEFSMLILPLQKNCDL